MVIDRLKSVSTVRAAKLTGITRDTISKAMDLYAATHGRLGLAFFVDTKRRKIRLCSLDDWMSRMEEDSRYGEA